MSKLVKYTIAPEAEKYTALDAVAMTNHYPEILDQFEPLFVQAKSYEEAAKQLKRIFDESKSNEDRLSLSDDAKKIRLAIRSTRTKKGAEAVKIELKEVSKGYNNTIDACFNAIEKFDKALEADMQTIEDYSEKLRLEEEDKERQRRISDVEQIEATEFLSENEDPAAYSPENWDARMLQLEELVALKKFKKEQEAKAEAERIAKDKAEQERKAKADKIRALRAKQLHKVNAFYEGDLFSLDEIEFAELLEQKTEEYNVKIEADRVAKEKVEKERELNKLRHHRQQLLNTVRSGYEGDLAELSKEAFDLMFSEARNIFEQEEAEKAELARIKAEQERKAKEAQEKAEQEAQARLNQQYQNQKAMIESNLGEIGKCIDLVSINPVYLTNPQALKEYNEIIALLEKAYNYYVV